MGAEERGCGWKGSGGPEECPSFGGNPSTVVCGWKSFSRGRKWDIGETMGVERNEVLEQESVQQAGMGWRGQPEVGPGTTLPL